MAALFLCPGGNIAAYIQDAFVSLWQRSVLLAWSDLETLKKYVHAT